MLPESHASHALDGSVRLQAFPVVKLRRTNIRIVHKVANTVGRVMTTGINIANKATNSSLPGSAVPGVIFSNTRFWVHLTQQHVSSVHSTVV